MFSLILLRSVDPHLGRVDYSSLSKQILVEFLYEGFDQETRKKYQDKEGIYLDVCKWSSVECDADRRVVKIQEHGRFSGSLQLCYLPP